MTETRTSFIAGYGGARLAVHRIGAGRPVVLLHGLFSSGDMNWIRHSHARRLADAGFEAIVPDLRAHGQSDASHDPAAYPADVLVKDALALVSELELADYDLAGFSLGSRTAARAVLAGLSPRRLVLGGIGIEGLGNWAERSEFFVNAIDRYDVIKRGDPDYFAQQFMKTMRIDRVAARLLLASVDDTSPDDLARITMPTLIVCGSEDHDNGNAPALAKALPNGRYVEIPGTHMSSVPQRELGEAIVDFLTA